MKNGKIWIDLVLSFWIGLTCMLMAPADAQGNRYASERELYIVWPKKGDIFNGNESGAIYLCETMVENRDGDCRYPRKGYLPVGTLLQVSDEQPKNITHKVNGNLEPYLKFVGANGSFGYIHADAVRSMSRLIRAEGNLLDFSKIQYIVVPTEQIQVYGYPKDLTREPSPAFTFSRSNRKLVVTDKAYVRIPDGKTKYYVVKYAGKEIDPDRWKLKTGLIRASGNERYAPDGIGKYKIAPFSREKYEKTLPVKEECTGPVVNCGIQKFKDYLKLWIDDGETLEQIAIRMQKKKSCNYETTISISGAIQSTASFPIGGTISAERELKFPRGVSYAVERYRIGGHKNPVEVLHTIHCQGDSPAYCKRMQFKNLAAGEGPRPLLHSELYKRVKERFEVPEVSGSTAGSGGKKMFVVPYGRKNNDLFTPFSAIERYIRNKFRLKVSPAEEEKILSLLMENLVSWEEPPY